MPVLRHRLPSESDRPGSSRRRRPVPGIPQGQTILAIAVLAILFNAPLGLLGIRFFGNRLLEADGDEAFPLGQ